MHNSTGRHAAGLPVTACRHRLPAQSLTVRGSGVVQREHVLADARSAGDKAARKSAKELSRWQQERDHVSTGLCETPAQLRKVFGYERLSCICSAYCHH